MPPSMRMREGKGRLLLKQTFVATSYNLAHAGEVVYAGDALDDEFAVIGILHLAFFPDDHGGDGFGALDVGDVEALDALGLFGKHEDVLHDGLDDVCARLGDAETLIVGLLGVVADEVEQGALVSALRDCRCERECRAFR